MGKLRPITSQFNTAIAQPIILQPIQHTVHFISVAKKGQGKIIREFALPGANTSIRYSTYVENMTVLVTSNAMTDEDGRESNGTSGMEFLFPSDWPCKILCVWFGLDLQLEMNWLDVRENAEAAHRQWARRNHYLIRRAEVLF